MLKGTENRLVVVGMVGHGAGTLGEGGQSYKTNKSF